MVSTIPASYPSLGNLQTRLSAEHATRGYCRIEHGTITSPKAPTHQRCSDICNRVGNVACRSRCEPAPSWLEYSPHDAFKFGRHRFRQCAALGKEPTQVVVEGDLIERDAVPAAISFLFISTAKVPDLRSAQAVSLASQGTPAYARAGSGPPR
jgi:hypothetical protein